jgi:hypothetical protein
MVTGPAGVHYHHGAWVGGRDGPDQVVLAAGKVQRGAVEALGLDPVGGANDDHGDVGLLGQFDGVGELDVVGLAGGLGPEGERRHVDRGCRRELVDEDDIQPVSK